MFRRDTVFILGAGASVPFGLPSGEMLVDNILKLRRGQPYGDKYLPLLTELGVEDDLFLEFQRELADSTHYSIDAFLERRPKYLDIGKLAIALRLLPCESESILSSPNTHYETKNWYRVLLQRLTEGASHISQIAANKVTFVTFNYDRSLEHFLFSSLCSYYETNPSEVAAILAQLPIIHVHGRLGSLPWQSDNDQDVVVYGDWRSDAVQRAAKGIKIISEITPDTMYEFDVARMPILNASDIFFLGFGYHPDNVKRLQVPFMDKDGTWLGNRPRHICGTAFGLSDEEKENIKRNRCNQITLGHHLDTIDKFLKNCYCFLADE